MTGKQVSLLWISGIFILFVGIWIATPTDDTAAGPIFTPAPHTTVDRQPTEYERTQFMDGCMDTAADRAYCECTFDESIRSVGITRFIGWAQDLPEDADASDMPDEMLAAVSYCLDKIE